MHVHRLFLSPALLNFAIDLFNANSLFFSAEIRKLFVRGIAGTKHFFSRCWKKDKNMIFINKFDNKGHALSPPLLFVPFYSALRNL
jgi:hypothetical protein